MIVQIISVHTFVNVCSIIVFNGYAKVTIIIMCAIRISRGNESLKLKLVNNTVTAR